MVRVLGGGPSVHVENRIGEPCANPYLAIASQFFAGLEGLTDRGRAGKANQGRGLPRVPEGEKLPQSLREALEAFQGSDRARELLGESLAACLSKLKESEVSRFEEWLKENRVTDGEVTEWEHREYFRVF
jgi:glutamine synthetase